MFAAEATAVFAHQQGGIFGHLTEELAVAGLFDVEDGTQVQFASADMAIVDTAEAVALHHLLEFIEVFRQPLGCYGSILDHAYGLAVALDTGEYAETGFAESPHTADVVIEDTTAVVGEAAAEEVSLQGVGLLLHTDAVKLCDKQSLRLALDEELVGLLRMVFAAELKYLAIHELYSNRVVAQSYEVGPVAVWKGMAVCAEHHLLLGGDGVERELYGGDKGQSALAAAEKFA